MIAVPPIGRAATGDRTKPGLRSPPPKGGVGIKQIVRRTRQAGQGHCRSRSEARVQKDCVPLQLSVSAWDKLQTYKKKFWLNQRRSRTRHGVISILGDGVKDEDASQDWVTAGLAELAKGGVDSVRVEVLA